MGLISSSTWAALGLPQGVPSCWAEEEQDRSQAGSPRVSADLTHLSFIFRLPKIRQTPDSLASSLNSYSCSSKQTTLFWLADWKKEKYQKIFTHKVKALSLNNSITLLCVQHYMRSFQKITCVYEKTSKVKDALIAQEIEFKSKDDFRVDTHAAVSQLLMQGVKYLWGTLWSVLLCCTKFCPAFSIKIWYVFKNMVCIHVIHFSIT